MIKVLAKLGRTVNTITDRELIIFGIGSILGWVAAFAEFGIFSYIFR